MPNAFIFTFIFIQIIVCFQHMPSQCMVGLYNAEVCIRRARKSQHVCICSLAKEAKNVLKLENH